MAFDKQLIKDIAQTMGISPKWINKFSLVTIFFIVWVVFFDKHNVFTQQKLKNTIHKMEEEKQVLNDQIAQALEDKKDLQNDPEKFAREKYHMHQPDEEVTIIEKDK